MKAGYEQWTRKTEIRIIDRKLLDIDDLQQSENFDSLNYLIAYTTFDSEDQPDNLKVLQ